MNLQALQSGDLEGINGHNLRRAGHTSASIDPDLSGQNRMLDRSDVDWTPPAVQPDTGRKIRADARVAASFVMTLPEELGHDRLDEWVDASMKWINSLPGKTAYAVLHLDEPGARPHIHALRIPENEAGNLNYKRDFGGHRERLDEMHRDYALALEPLGVRMSAEEDRAKRRSARKEPEEPAQEHRPQRRQPKTRPAETPRADLEAELQAAKDLAQQQAEQLRQLQASQDEARRQAEERDEKRKAAEEKAREETVKQRDQEWRDHLEKQRNQVAGDIDRLGLPAAKTLEGAGRYRERVLDVFTSWRAKLLNYVADLKKRLLKEQRDSQELRERWESVMANTRPYREAVGLMNQDQRDNLDAGLEKFTAQTKEARAQAREQKRAQEQDRDGPVLGG